MTKTYPRPPPRGARRCARGEHRRGRAGPRARRDARRRARGERVGAGAHRGRPPHLQVLHRAARSRRAAPDHDRPIVLYCAGGIRSLFAAQTLQEMGYADVASMSGGFQAWKSEGRPFDDAGRPVRGAEAALLAPPAHPRGRGRRPGAAARLQGPAHRRGRPGLAGDAVPRGRRRGHARGRRLRRRRPLQPPAPGRPHDRPHRPEEDRLGRADDRARSTPTCASSPTRRCSPTRTSTGSSPATTSSSTAPTRSRRATRSTTPPSARGIPVVHASVFRFEGQLTVFMPVRGPVLPVPLPDAAAARARTRLLGRGRARRGAGHDGPAPGDRGDQGAARDRRPARRAPAHLRRPRRHVLGAPAAARPALPGLRRRRGRASPAPVTASSRCRRHRCQSRRR